MLYYDECITIARVRDACAVRRLPHRDRRRVAREPSAAAAAAAAAAVVVVVNLEGKTSVGREDSYDKRIQISRAPPFLMLMTGGG